MVLLNLPKGLMELLRGSLRSNSSIFLVGGAVRDLLLQKESHDYDFVVTGDVKPIARKVADHLKGAFYMLDDERQTARVIVEQMGSYPLVIDFATLRGGSLEKDLKTRDFTINALAVDLDQPDHLIDLVHGVSDLKEKVLNPCSDNSFLEDPARILRAVRFAVDLNCKLPPATKELLKKALPEMKRTSMERRRDELFRMFDLPGATISLRLMDRLGILPYVLPEMMDLKGMEQSRPHTLDVWDHTLSCIDNLYALLGHIVGEYKSEANTLILGQSVLQLGRFREKLAVHMNMALNPLRSRRSLLVFAALYHDAGKAKYRQEEPDGRIRFLGHEKGSARLAVRRGRQLALSQMELNYLESINLHHMRIHQLSSNEARIPSHRAIFRYFRETQETGVDIGLLSLADTLATWQTNLDQKVWMKELEVCRSLFEAWFDPAQMIVKPPKLLNGTDLQVEFNLPAGPLIGRMLETLQENQAAGEIENRNQALEFLRAWLEKEGVRNE